MYHKLVNITKQGAPLELMRKKKTTKNGKKQCRKAIGKVGCNRQPPNFSFASGGRI